MLADGEDNEELIVALTVAQIVADDVRMFRVIGCGKYCRRGLYDRQNSKDMFDLLHCSGTLIPEFGTRYLGLWRTAGSKKSVLEYGDYHATARRERLRVGSDLWYERPFPRSLVLLLYNGWSLDEHCEY